VVTDGRDGHRAGSGAELHGLCRRLFPIVRSITGTGVRDTLRILGEYINLDLHEVPSGTPVFDWTVPPEWNVSAAHITSESGERIVDLADHSLHLVSYSEPVKARLTLEQLQPHLHSLPEHPDWIPYRTSYYARSWGFCLPHSRREALRPGNYDVVVDTTLKAGSLTYGECVIPGETDREILVSTHVCHPSLANDNLSGISVATFLARHLMARADRPAYTYRFIFIPGTIGSITWIARNHDKLHKIAGGVVLSGIGDPGPLHYKRTKSGCAVVDRVFGRVLHRRGQPFHIEDFSPYGYDERQFNSPGINVPVGCFTRTPFGRYPEYHTSGDNLDLITPAALEESLDACREALAELDLVQTYRNLAPNCEPQLGRRGLYDETGGDNDRKSAQMALLWMLSYSEGTHSTLDISELSGLDLATLDRAARRLAAVDLLARC
jgi:aminopeptidase-like protein